MVYASVYVTVLGHGCFLHIGLYLDRLRCVFSTSCSCCLAYCCGRDKTLLQVMPITMCFFHLPPLVSSARQPLDTTSPLLFMTATCVHVVSHTLSTCLRWVRVYANHRGLENSHNSAVSGVDTPPSFVDPQSLTSLQRALGHRATRSWAW